MVRISAQLCKRPFTREQIPRNKRATRGHGGNVLSESYGACTFYTYTRFEKQFIESLGRRVDRKNGQRSRRQQRAHLFQLYTGCTSSSVWLFFFHRGRKCALLAASPSLVLRCVKPRPSLSHSPHLKKKKWKGKNPKHFAGLPKHDHAWSNYYRAHRGSIKRQTWSNVPTDWRLVLSLGFHLCTGFA